MGTHGDDERGDTLVEILLAIVLIGLMMGVLFASITMASTGSNNQKNLAIADGILRNYAETAKQTVRTACASPATFTVATPTAPWDQPGIHSVSSTPNLSAGQPCPAKPPATGPGVLIVRLRVDVPDASAKELEIAVRAP